MRYVTKHMNKQNFDFLELTVYDKEDEAELSLHKGATHVTVGMDMLPYLRQLPNVQHVILTPGELGTDEYEPLYELNPLTLKIDYENPLPEEPRIDLSRLPNLEFLFSRSQLNYTNADRAVSLKTLIAFNWQDEDLSSLIGSGIDSLQIIKGKLKSLNGIEHMKQMKALSLSHLRGLTDISNLSLSQTLKYLEIECCGSVKQQNIPAMPQLESLVWLGSNKISSLNTCVSLPKLKRILLEVSIEDGKLDCLMSLEHASLMSDKRHYNRKDKDLPKSCIPYSIEGIPEYRAISLSMTDTNLL